GTILSAAAGALGWNFVMWRLAMPTSSGHALIGALRGAFLGAYGAGSIHWPVFGRMVGLLALVPFAGALFGFGLSRAAYWAGGFLTPAWGPLLRYVQIGALAGTAVVHGSNDGQKPMALIVLALAARGAFSASGLAAWPVTLA